MRQRRMVSGPLRLVRRVQVHSRDLNDNDKVFTSSHAKDGREIITTTWFRYS